MLRISDALVFAIVRIIVAVSIFAFYYFSGPVLCSVFVWSWLGLGILTKLSFSNQVRVELRYGTNRLPPDSVMLG
jgi:hypothetical protein